MTVEELLNKVKERDPDGILDDDAALKAACWFIACQEARFIYELTVKDLAREFVDGTILAGPFKTREDVEDWIGQQDEIYEDEQERWVTLDEDLDRHFGIKR